MDEVRRLGLSAARHLRGEIYEVRAEGMSNSIRLLFANEGKKGRILLALTVYEKRRQKALASEMRLAERRLADWRRRGKEAKKRRR